MSEVKRYKRGYMEMACSDDGEYVEYEDYARLEKRNADLREKNAAMEKVGTSLDEALEEIRRTLLKINKEWNGDIEQMEKFINEIKQLAGL